jgi:hypothetical protein
MASCVRLFHSSDIFKFCRDPRSNLLRQFFNSVDFSISHSLRCGRSSSSCHELRAQAEVPRQSHLLSPQFTSLRCYRNHSGSTNNGECWCSKKNKCVIFFCKNLSIWNGIGSRVSASGVPVYWSIFWFTPVSPHPVSPNRLFLSRTA